MVVIENELIPFKGFKCINLCGILFVRSECNMDDIDLKHESIHSSQIFEMLIIFFYLWYVFEWIFRLFQYGSSHEAYRNISFEREAYANENNLDYEHSFYGWAKYLRLKKYS